MDINYLAANEVMGKTLHTESLSSSVKLKKPNNKPKKHPQEKPNKPTKTVLVCN